MKTVLSTNLIIQGKTDGLIADGGHRIQEESAGCVCVWGWVHFKDGMPLNMFIV